jgi:hypothetical protein
MKSKSEEQEEKKLRERRKEKILCEKSVEGREE